jgi:serine/threonine protein kinase
MPEQPQKPDEIFWRALEIEPAEERAKYLSEACAQNAALRAEVDELLAAYPKVERFLEKPAAEAGPTVDRPVLTERAGSKIGPYKLLQQIGEGGMGVVWMAEQEHPVRRRVALKIIKPGMDSQHVIARFEAERQALALMEHQNIARVYDAGTTESGRPYFVMELVHGVPITKYCDDNHLTPRERLELFVPVCHAIQHAHQKGIIHRDIKPTNIMVCLYDGRPVPKIIDFGVAKATEQRLTERTLFTSYGSIVGTFEYMSPEQSEMSQLGIDTRSDIYSLGVLLYELLTGTTPLDRSRLKNAAIDELLRIIREEEPPKPSTRLSESKESLPSLAALRKTEPGQLANLVRGDLDWIVMKCLEKDRQRRYESAVVLAKELERYLHDEPVEARPPSARYRLGKFLRKNRAAVLTAGVVAASLLFGVGIAATGWWRQAERPQTPPIAALDPTGLKESVLSLIRQRKYAESDRKVDEVAAILERHGSKSVLGNFWMDVAYRYFVQYEYGRAQRAYERAATIDDASTNLVWFWQSGIATDLGDDREATALVEKSIERLERSHNNLSQLADHHLFLAFSYATQGEFETSVARYEPYIDAALKSEKSGLRIAPDSWGGRNFDCTLLAMYYLARHRVAKESSERAAHLETAHQLITKRPSVFWGRSYIAVARDDLDDAIAANNEYFEFLRQRGETSRRIGIGRLRQADETLTDELIRAGQFQRAEKLLADRIQGWKSTLHLPPHHPVHAHYLVLCGRVLREQKNFAAAEKQLLAASDRLDSDPLTPLVRREQVLQELVTLYDAWNQPAESAKFRSRLKAAEALSTSPGAAHN